MPGPHVFPSPKRAALPLSESSVCHWAERLSREVGARWIPKDLRRTCATGLARLGASREIRRRLLNHAPEGIGDVYDQHDYLAELASFLERWGESVAAASVMRPSP